VENGVLVEPIRLSDIDAKGRMIVLDLRTEAISAATALTAVGLPPALQTSRRCLLYVGSGDGVMVLYDVKSPRLIRAPTASAAVEFERPKPRALPHDCLAGPGHVTAPRPSSR
jgi:hypothetical protein